MRLFLLLWGCSAHFVDERPFSPVDLALGDLSLAPDLAPAAGTDLAGGNDLAGMDLAPASPHDLAPQVVARGTFMGRAGHSGAGTASLVRGPGGLSVELGADFVVTAAPGPELVLTARDSIGTQIDAADLDLGPLQSSQGAQSYALSDDGGRRRLFVYCKPFGVEIALAVLQ